MNTKAQQVLLNLLERKLTVNFHNTSEEELASLGKADRQLWLDIISVAEKQEVCGLLFDAIATLPAEQKPDQELLMRFAATIMNMEQGNKSYRQEVVKMFDSLKAEGLDPILLKGLAIAELYPNPLHRHVGDIDLFVPLDRQHQFIKCFEKDGAKKDTEFDAKHTLLKHNGFSWELHFRSTYFFHPRSEHRFRILEAEDTSADMLCHETIDERSVTVFPPMLNMVYLTAHIQHHLVLEYVTLRQVIDWTLILHHERTALGIGEVALVRQLERLGLYKLYRAIGYISTTYLGLAANSYAGLSKLSKSDARRGEYLMKIIMQGHVPGCSAYNVRSKNDTMLTRIKLYGELVKRCFFLRNLCLRESFATPFGFAVNALRRRLSEH